MSKVDGKFQFSPISVNFLTEVAKVIFAIVMLIIQVCSWLLAPMYFCCACTVMMSHDVIHGTPFCTSTSCLDSSEFYFVFVRLLPAFDISLHCITHVVLLVAEVLYSSIASYKLCHSTPFKNLCSSEFFCGA